MNGKFLYNGCMWSARNRYSSLSIEEIHELLGEEADSLLTYKSTKISAAQLYLPQADFVDKIFAGSDRSDNVLKNLKRLFNHGRLSNTGYLSILPVDQGVEHAAGFSFYKNPAYFDPQKIVQLALEGGCNGVASSFGVLGAVARKYAGRIPFIVKLNHNELLTYPNVHDQIMFGTVKRAAEMGAVAVGATIYFGSAESRTEIVQVAEAFALAHELGLATILWAYVRNPAFKVGKTNNEQSADITGQANYLAATLQADIIKQKLPISNGGYKDLNTGNSSYGKFEPAVYDTLIGEHPIDLTRYQVLNNFSGRIGLLNSGGSSAANDVADVVRTAVINKRAGGMGVIAGRKVFQRPFNEGVDILHKIQDVYLCKDVTIA
jgi:class I fructose-bisphosphate aldolase